MYAKVIAWYLFLGAMFFCTCLYLENAQIIKQLFKKPVKTMVLFKCPECPWCTSSSKISLCPIHLKKLIRVHA